MINWQRRQPEEKALDLGLETLEARQMLAGDVVVNLNSSGDLTIQGDNQSNIVDVYSERQDEVTITGLDGTHVIVDGQSYDEYTFDLPTEEIADDVRIKMRGGDDQVMLRFLSIGGDLKVNMGAGEDIAVLSFSEVGDDAQLLGGSGRYGDKLSVTNSSIGDDLRINSGPGSKTFDMFTPIDEIGVSADVSDPIAKNVSLRGGSGVTVVAIGATFDGKLSVNTGSGDDGIVFIAANLTDEVSISTGSGNDALVFEGGTTFQDELHVSLGSGDDRVDFADYTQSLGSAKFKGGSGTNVIYNFDNINTVTLDDFDNFQVA